MPKLQAGLNQRLLERERAAEQRRGTEQRQHPADAEEHPFGIYHPNKDDANTTTININLPIYRHVECTPVEEPIEVNFKITEFDTTGDETLADVAESVPLRSDFTKTLRQVGAATFTYQTVFGPVPAHDPKCAAGMPSAPSPKVAIRVDPPHPYATPGTVVTVAVLVTNLSNEQATYRLALEPLRSASLTRVEISASPGPEGVSVEERNRTTTAVPPNALAAVASWASLDTAQVTLRPRETKRLGATFRVDALVETVRWEYPDRTIPVETTTMTAALLIGTAMLWPTRCLRKPPAAVWLFVAYAYAYWAAVGTGGGFYINDAIRATIILLQLVLVVTICANILREQQIADRALLIFATACVILAAMTLLGIGTKADVDADTQMVRMTVFGQNANRAARILGSGLLILVGVAYGRARALIRPAWLVWPFIALIALAVIDGIFVGAELGGRFGSLGVGLGRFGAVPTYRADLGWPVRCLHVLDDVEPAIPQPFEQHQERQQLMRAQMRTVVDDDVERRLGLDQGPKVLARTLVHPADARARPGLRVRRDRQGAVRIAHEQGHH